eukprot:TRINITY_DN46993_c0_g1_i1.p1 TRINITY_DN46993_c0_g1~~TRINITY_DN46993_c0_g1_i1.p1  ORF type:complete len:816 (+),score=260.33 TRINITY_DN46993_c0_g1_i1:87-2450(+)
MPPKKRRSSVHNYDDGGGKYFNTDANPLPAMDGAVVHHGDELQMVASRMTAFNVDVGMRFSLRYPMSATAGFGGNPDRVCECVAAALRVLIRSISFYAFSVRKFTRAARFLTLFFRRHLRRARALRAAVVERWRGDEKRMRDGLRGRIQACQRRSHTQTSGVLVGEYGQIFVSDSEKPAAVYHVYIARMHAQRTLLREWYSQDRRGKAERRLIAAVVELCDWKHALRPDWQRRTPGMSALLDQPPMLATPAAAMAALDPGEGSEASSMPDEVSAAAALRPGELDYLCSTATRNEMPGKVAERRRKALAAARKLRQARPRFVFGPGDVPIEELIATARALSKRGLTAADGRDVERHRIHTQVKSELKEVRAYCSDALRALRDQSQEERRGSFRAPSQSFRDLPRGSFRGSVAGSFRKGGPGWFGSFSKRLSTFKRLSIDSSSVGDPEEARDQQKARAPQPEDGAPPGRRKEADSGLPRRQASFVLKGLEAKSPQPEPPVLPPREISAQFLRQPSSDPMMETVRTADDPFDVRPFDAFSGSRGSPQHQQQPLQLQPPQRKHRASISSGDDRRRSPSPPSSPVPEQPPPPPPRLPSLRRGLTPAESAAQRRSSTAVAAATAKSVRTPPPPGLHCPAPESEEPEQEQIPPQLPPLKAAPRRQSQSPPLSGSARLPSPRGGGGHTPRGAAPRRQSLAKAVPTGTPRAAVGHQRRSIQSPASPPRPTKLPPRESAALGAEEQRARLALGFPVCEYLESCGRRALRLAQDAQRGQLKDAQITLEVLLYAKLGHY